MNQVEFELICPREILDDPNYTGPCEAEFTVNQDIIPGEHYGADADGNRSIWIPASIELNIDYLPKACPLGHEFTQHEIKILKDQLEAKIDGYSWDE